MEAIVQYAPRFDAREAADLALRLYGLEAEARPLPSERDQNFRLAAADGREFVLKIANATESREVLDFQNEALAHIAAQPSPPVVPRLVPTIGGEVMTTIAGRDGQHHFVRLLTWIPGVVFAEVRPHDQALLASLGHRVGEMDKALAGFEHPAMHRPLPWNLKTASWIRPELDRIAPNLRPHVSRLLEAFERTAVPRFPDLRQQVVHNDWNDYNVLVTLPGSEAPAVVGAIDFGDMVHSFLVADLATACAYAMLGKPDAIGAAAAIVGGYHRVLPLAEAELDVLYDFICARLAVSVTMAALQGAAAPANEYLQISQQHVSALVEQLSAVPHDWPRYVFRDACGLAASPRSAAIVSWIERNRARTRPVTGRDLASVRLHVLDVSVGSLDSADSEDADTFSRMASRMMAQAGAAVGIGRYDEARLVYCSDSYRVPGNDGDEWRTVHIGIDVFIPAGSPIYAPLPGRVHSFANNAAPLDYGPTIVLEHEAEGAGPFYTLYGHLSLDSLDGLEEGMTIEAGREIARIGDEQVNGGWPPHLHFQVITDMLGRRGDFPGVAVPRLRRVWRSLCPDPNLLLGIPANRFPRPALRGDEILAARRAHVGRNLSVSYGSPLTIVRGRGQFLYDDEGRRFLDAVNNVPHVGHGHPRVVRAAAEQLAVLSTNTRYLHENLVRYASRLTALLPAPLNVCYFVCSGSEANELALRLARTYTGRKGVIVVDHAYHGNTTSLVEISPYKFNGPGGSGRPPYVRNVVMPDPYRGPFRRGDADAGARYAREVERAAAALRADGEGVAAFFCEPVMGCGGQIVLPDGYLGAAFEAVRRAGGVCVADEVQVGFGRVGTHTWAFETQGVVPDIVTMGKPIGNGFPLGAVVTRPEIAAAFDNGMEYFNTFGGGPVPCAVGLAVLDVMRDEGLRERALEVGTYLKGRLQELATRFPVIGDVRGLGMFLGIELVRDRASLEPAAAQADYVANRLRARGVLLSTEGPLHNVLKMKPPLAFGRKDADVLVETLEGILREDLAQP